MSFALPTDLQLGEGAPKPAAAASTTGAVTTRAAKKKESTQKATTAPATGTSSSAAEPTVQTAQSASGPKTSATATNSATQAAAPPAGSDPAGDPALLHERIRQLEGLLRQQAAAAAKASAPQQATTTPAASARQAPQATAQPASAHPQPPAQRLVATHDQIEGMRMFAEAMGRAPNQATKTLPAIVPGKKADPYQLVVPEHVLRVIRTGGYVPYSVLSAPATAASTPALDVGLLASLTPNKPLDRTGEDRIDQRTWMPISRAVEAATRTHLGDQRANALQKHHDHVINLASTYDWPAARLYDIKEREAYASDPSLDISVQCSERTAMISNEFHARRNREATAFVARTSPAVRRQPPPPSRDPYNRDQYQRDAYSRKRPRTDGPVVGAGSHCFRCGYTEHMPAACPNSTTIAGQQCAPLHTGPGSTSAHALAAPSGAAYCFHYAVQGTCRSGSRCANHHGCSICKTDGDHGARNCPRV